MVDSQSHSNNDRLKEALAYAYLRGLEMDLGMKPNSFTINNFQKECLLPTEPKPTRGVSYNHDPSKQTASNFSPLDIDLGRDNSNPQG